MSKLIREGIVIVISILLAFAIDAWWDLQKEKRIKREILIGLRSDFEANQHRIDSAITDVSQMIRRARAFIQATGDPSTVSSDSLYFFAMGLYSKIFFEPITLTYQSALNRGEMGEIGGRNLHRLLTEFDRIWKDFELTEALMGDAFFSGPAWEMRREIGGMTNLRYNPEKMTLDEYHNLLKKPIVLSASETIFTAKLSILKALEGMSEISDEILEELELQIED